MSLRKILVQYVGSCLFLPKLERDVKLITTWDGKQFVEVVRCRDCKHICNREYKSGPVCHTCSYFDSEYAEVEPDGFCAWAERRDDDR